MNEENSDQLLAIFTDKNVYNEGDIVRIKGVLKKRLGIGQIVIQIVSMTQGNTVFTGKYPLKKDSDFVTTWRIQGSLLKPDTYQIFASIGENQISTTFEYSEPGFEKKPKENLFDNTISKQKDSTRYIERYFNDPSFKRWFENAYPDKSIYDVFGSEQAGRQTRQPEIENIERLPQNYLERYNEEPAFREWFDKKYPNVTIERAVGLERGSKIPQWVKNVFASYVDDRITDEELIDSIRFLIDEGIIKA